MVATLNSCELRGVKKRERLSEEVILAQRVYEQQDVATGVARGRGLKLMNNNSFEGLEKVNPLASKYFNRLQLSKMPSFCMLFLKHVSLLHVHN